MIGLITLFCAVGCVSMFLTDLGTVHLFYHIFHLSFSSHFPSPSFSSHYSPSLLPFPFLLPLFPLASLFFPYSSPSSPFSSSPSSTFSSSPSSPSLPPLPSPSLPPPPLPSRDDPRVSRLHSCSGQRSLDSSSSRFPGSQPRRLLVSLRHQMARGIGRRRRASRQRRRHAPKRAGLPRRHAGDAGSQRFRFGRQRLWWKLLSRWMPPRDARSLVR